MPIFNYRAAHLPELLLLLHSARAKYINFLREINVYFTKCLINLPVDPLITIPSKRSGEHTAPLSHISSIPFLLPDFGTNYSLDYIGTFEQLPDPSQFSPIVIVLYLRVIYLSHCYIFSPQ